ncbi:CYTH domain-containing protein [Carnobacterium funditum]|uniref:CYTH domain-containing protein n=1 Tax=Carnobacterium funditum TaxID=2752 RepID=UPI0005543F00|nr:CYTH domain-containing protein [Carnobacterium funditum]
MSEEFEIEFKNKLSAKDYYRLLNYYKAEEGDFFIQENHYFDSTLWELKKMHAGLRIRVLDDTAELTLKTPLNKHLLETTDYLSIIESEDLLLKDQIYFTGHVARKLRELNINPKDMHLIGSLKTKRFEKQTSVGLIVLDQSFYGEQTDFELEFEVHEAQTGEIAFDTFLKKHQLKKNRSENKIVRMINNSLKNKAE